MQKVERKIGPFKISDLPHTRAGFEMLTVLAKQEDLTLGQMRAALSFASENLEKLAGRLVPQALLEVFTSNPDDPYQAVDDFLAQRAGD